eukprot:10734051-Lingulodinium_polyedra.AAC.1
MEYARTSMCNGLPAAWTNPDKILTDSWRVPATLFRQVAIVLQATTWLSGPRLQPVWRLAEI